MKSRRENRCTLRASAAEVANGGCGERYSVVKARDGPGQNPLGRRFKLGGDSPPATVVGVGPVDVATLALTSVLLLAATVGASLLPAMRAARVSPVEAMRGTAT